MIFWKRSPRPSQTPLEALAEKVTSTAKQVSSWCANNDQPQPSFGDHAASLSLPPSAPQDIRVVREELIEAAARIQQLVIEPSEYIPRMAVHYQVLASIHWLCRFGIFSLIPLTDSASFSELAARAGVPERQLKATTRMAMTTGVLREKAAASGGSALAHTPVSTLLATSPAARDWVAFMAEFSAPAAAGMVEATRRWGFIEGRNRGEREREESDGNASMVEAQTAFNAARGTDLPFFHYISQDPDLTALFASYMKNITASPGLRIDHLVHGFDWAGLGNATVVDMGGSTGHASIALAEAYLLLNFIVQDLPETIAGARAALAKQPEVIRSRIACEEHDFFTPQSADSDAANTDVFLLRTILHDWPDDRAITILRHLVPILRARPMRARGGRAFSSSTSSNGGASGRPGYARLVIMDTVLPLPGEVGPSREAMLRVRDLAMLQVFNSKERELADWKALLHGASTELAAEDGAGKLELVSMHQPFGSLLSILEVAYVVS